MTPGNQDESRATRRWVAIGIVIFACLLISVGIVILRNKVPDAATGGAIPAGIHTACSKTFHPQLCVSTLGTYPGVDQLVEPKDFVQATIEATIAQVLQSYSLKVAAHVWGDGDGDGGVAQQDCVELLRDTLYHLNATLLHMSDLSGKRPSLLFIADVKTWLSAALTNQDTCLEGFHFQNLIGGGNATLQSSSAEILKEIRKFAQLISNSLSLFQTLFSNAGLENKALPGEQTNKSAVPQNPRRMLPRKNNAGFKKDEGNNAGLEQELKKDEGNNSGLEQEFKKDEGHNAGLDQEFYQHYGLLDRYDMKEFPLWLSPTDRLLLLLSPADLRPDAVVAQDGSGNYVTISDAVKEAPKHLRSRKYIIYVKAGLYLETVKISKRKTNIMFVGDGKGKTVVVSSKNVKEGSTTFSSATFAVSGAGFVARDMSFMNSAGPDKHQAVALRVGADFAAIYRCSIIGYQDTLYVHSLRQFYRECDVFGTVDLIFGNAAVVLQECNIYARQGMPNQMSVITAQGRNRSYQNTDISIHNCIVTATSDLTPWMAFTSTYLGRPWKLYSRTIYMQSFLGDLIHPADWLEWSGEFALESLYFGEYRNFGPGAFLDGRVTWAGYRVIKTVEEAKEFSVPIFIPCSAVESHT
eukprot:PITA_24094